MPSVQYGNTKIEYEIRQEEGLKNDYIQVEQGSPVLYRTARTEEEQANKMVLKRARWILQKLRLVAEPIQEQLQTGSRLPYFGRKYYVELKKGDKNSMRFTGGKFVIILKEYEDDALEKLLRSFYKKKAECKISKRFEQWIKKTQLVPQEVIFRKVEKRWGSCSSDNRILINTEVAKLPWELIDYLIVHELCHIKHKGHTKAFWSLIRQYIPDYEERDRKMDWMEF